MCTMCGRLLFTLPGTCINNTGVFMFKKGCFELGATIYPAVIKVSDMAPSPLPCSTLVIHSLPCIPLSTRTLSKFTALTSITCRKHGMCVCVCGCESFIEVL